MLTLPNLLTLSRILAVPILVFLLWRPGWFDYSVTFVLYCLVGITDYFDGYLARAQGTVSRLGQFLDPIADKIMVAAVIVMLIARPSADGQWIIADWHLIPAMVILLREIIVSGLREFLASLQVSVPVSALAKWKTTLQLVALGALILASLQVSVPVSALAKWKTTLQLVALGALILAGAVPQWPWVHQVGLASLWAAAALTLVTGWDYLRVGLKHMD